MSNKLNGLGILRPAAIPESFPSKFPLYAARPTVAAKGQDLF